MARQPLNLSTIISRLRHTPFKVLSRGILRLASLIIFIFVSWITYHIYFEAPNSLPIVVDQRTELLQNERIDDLKTYAKNSDVPPFPGSVFPMTDLSIVR